MKYVHKTWYLLADGTQADPNDVAPGDDGVLRHKNGVPVAVSENGVLQTIGIDASTENMNVQAAEVGVSELAPADDAGDGDKEASEVGKTEVDPAAIDDAANDPDGKPVSTEAPHVPAREVVAAKPKKAKDREMKAGNAKTYETR